MIRFLKEQGYIANAEELLIFLATETKAIEEYLLNNNLDEKICQFELAEEIVDYLM